MYVIFPTHVSTKEPIWFRAFVLSQKKCVTTSCFTILWNRRIEQIPILAEFINVNLQDCSQDLCIFCYNTVCEIEIFGKGRTKKEIQTAQKLIVEFCNILP